ncbi:hypothetical protein QE152_g28380 [Popillia japonica]|uniref:Uncharacterized protein n=1 Tax=Popillia japonica TaxID=7064 RepID=A0AAW1JJQ6_POPJA
MPKRTAPTALKIQTGKSFSQAVAAPTWTATQAQLKESQTPKRRKAPQSRLGPRSQTPKVVTINPESSRGAGIAQTYGSDFASNPYLPGTITKRVG